MLTTLKPERGSFRAEYTLKPSVPQIRVDNAGAVGVQHATTVMMAGGVNLKANATPNDFSWDVKETDDPGWWKAPTNPKDIWPCCGAAGSGRPRSAAH